MNQTDEWSAKVPTLIRSPKGQSLLRELAAALDAIPERRLIDEMLIDEEGGCCAIGALCRARGIDTAGMDDDGIECVAERLGVPLSLAYEVIEQNDDRYDATPEDRWRRMRRWVDRHITNEE